MAKPLPPIDELFDRFYVDSTSPSGLRYAKDCGKMKRGQVAGCQGIDKYWKTNLPLNGRKVTRRTSRIVAAMKSGSDHLDMEVDHIDRNPENNHPFNLRWVSSSNNNRNQRNRGKCLRGVTFDKRPDRTKPYGAKVKINGKSKFLGMFRTEEEAHQAYISALRTYQLALPCEYLGR